MSLKDGLKVEEKLINDLKKHNFDVKRSSEREDIYDHIDIFFRKNKNEYTSADVKGLKKKNRTDKNIQYETHYIEFINVNGDDGWLYGKSEYIIFEDLKDWIFVERIELMKFIREKIKFEFVFTAGDSLYRLYSRVGRKDLITMVKISDLRIIATFFLKKIVFNKN